MSNPPVSPLTRSDPPPRRYRFGPFQLDVRAGELRKHGTRVRLREQTLQVLLMLLEHPGEIVLREEIRQRLWPGNTVVDFDHSINVAIQKLREVFGESAEKPRYIETMMRRGYRFLERVEADLEVPEADSLPQPPPHLPPPPPLPPPLIPAPVPIQASVPARRRHFTGSIVGGVCLLALLGWLRAGEPRAPERNWILSIGPVGLATISPNGSAVVYRKSGKLVLRHSDSLVETPLTLPSPAIDEPAWSPDGSQLAVQTVDGLFRLQLTNGATATVCRTLGPTRGISWGDDGTIVFAVYEKDAGSGLYHVAFTGGPPVRLDIPGLSGGSFYEPRFLPGGEDFLFAWAPIGERDAGLYLATIRKGKLSRGPLLLRKGMTAGKYSPYGGGRLLYVQDDKLYAQKLNTRSGTLEVEPQHVLDGVYSRPAFRRAHFSVSHTGVLVWQAGTAALAQPTWFDRHGNAAGVSGRPYAITDLRLSPDEKRMLIMETASRRTGIVGSYQTGYIALPSITSALWMPDHVHILCARQYSGYNQIALHTLAGAAEKELARLPLQAALRDISPDGRVLLYTAGWALNAIRIDGTPQEAKPQPLRPASEMVFHARFSPDGRWIVYSAHTEGRVEVYAQPFDLGAVPTQISVDGGREPVWRGDGEEILYRNNSKIYSVRVRTSRTEIQAGPPRALFDVRVPDTLVGMSEPLAVTRDGSRILFAQSTDPSDTKMMTYLTYLMPTGER